MARRVWELANGAPWESLLWNGLMSVPFVPPADVSLDLLSRGIAVAVLGHHPHSDEVLLAYAAEVPEALLTLAKRRYLSDDYGPEKFREALKVEPNSRWMLSALVREVPSDPAKARLLCAYVARHADRRELEAEACEAYHDAQ